MIKLEKAIIVEGKYDKIKLASIIDAPIITTNGFSVFKDKEKMNFIKSLAKKRGIIVLTDSDSAGFLIRNHIFSCIPKEQIINVYIPDVFGKEKRKREKGAEGKIGVEGIDKDVLIEAFKRAGVFGDEVSEKSKQITKLDLFENGLTGTDCSKERRAALLKKLKFPQRMTTNALLEALNIFIDYNEFIEICDKLFSED